MAGHMLDFSTNPLSSELKKVVVATTVASLLILEGRRRS